MIFKKSFHLGGRTFLFLELSHQEFAQGVNSLICQMANRVFKGMQSVLDQFGSS